MGKQSFSLNSQNQFRRQVSNGLKIKKYSNHQNSEHLVHLKNKEITSIKPISELFYFIGHPFTLNPDFDDFDVGRSNNTVGIQKTDLSGF